MSDTEPQPAPSSSSAAASASASSSSTETQKLDQNKDIGVEALNHLLQGKRHLILHDYSSAVTSFQESCQLFDKKYGIGADECGDAYLYYGSALLELAREETGVIDGVVHTKVTEQSEDSEEEEDDDDESGDDDDEQSQEKVSDVKDETVKKPETEEDIELSDDDKKDKDNANAHITDLSSSSAQQSNVDSVMNQSSSVDHNTENPPNETCQPSTSKGADKDEDGDDENEASSIEIAWEVLQLAKAVFTRGIDKEGVRPKLAETLQKLGEISIEWENNANAIDILTECLSHRKEILKDDDRLIAETYYHLGLAYSFSNNYENANDCFRSAIQVIENRIENQKKKIISIPSEQFEAIFDVKQEIAQLEDLLPEMRAKIEDSQDQMHVAMKALQDEVIEQMETEVTSKCQVKEKPINDISHLIKRKRPIGEASQSPNKVMCSNGHNVLNPSTRSESIVTDAEITEENKV